VFLRKQRYEYCFRSSFGDLLHKTSMLSRKLIIFVFQAVEDLLNRLFPLSKVNVRASESSSLIIERSDNDLDFTRLPRRDNLVMVKSIGDRMMLFI
jgi:hypothetical protein